MAGMLRVPRSRGAFSGLVLVLLGAWGALVPFIGPYFHYAFTPDGNWVYTSGRLWLEILPGVAAALGGLIVLVSANRPLAAFGAGLAALGGAWFVLGRTFSAWPATHIPQVGTPTGGALLRTVEDIGFFTGLGVAIVFLAAFALGRFAVLGAREAARAEAAAAAEARAEADERAAEPDETTTSPGRRVASSKSDLTSTRPPSIR